MVPGARPSHRPDGWISPGGGRAEARPRAEDGCVVSEIDGFTLRQLRKHAGVGLDRVAKQARVSASHLGRVERGVPDRPVTPAIVAAYEKVLGVKLGRGDELDPTGEPDREQLSRFDELRRRGFNATVAMLSVGGPLGEPIEHLLKSSAPAPSQVGTADVT